MGLRIITGSLKKKKLLSVRGNKTRPTADRLRETIFNILYDNVSGAVVLDLFAGTGALGIEALSRGADYVIFVEKSKAATNIIKQNIKLCKLENKTTVMTMDALKDLRCIKSITPFFDMVFMDPPYNKGLIMPTLMNLRKSFLLKKNACIVVESSDKEVIPQSCNGYNIYDQRKYGRTVVFYLTYIE